MIAYCSIHLICLNTNLHTDILIVHVHMSVAHFSLPDPVIIFHLSPLPVKNSNSQYGSPFLIPQTPHLL